MIAKNKILDVPIRQIENLDWNVRFYPQDKEAFDSLIHSIERDGLLNPITVITRDYKQFKVVAGRRRLAACAGAGMQSIPCYALYESDYSEGDLRRIALIENVMRSNLNDIEKGLGLQEIYKHEGYDNNQMLQGVNTLRNLFNRHPEFKDMNVRYLISHVRETVKDRPNDKKDNFIPDERFMDVCFSIPYKPVTQYTLLQQVIKTQIDVLEKAHKSNLSQSVRLALTHSILRKHPRIQKALIRKVKGKPDHIAMNIIHQAVQNLASGYTKQTDDGEYISGYTTKDEIESEPETEAVNDDLYYELTGEIEKILYVLTGKAISKGTSKYTEDTIKKTHNHRLGIVKSCNSDLRQLNVLYLDYLKILKVAIDDMMKLTLDEIDTARKKQEMMKR